MSNFDYEVYTDAIRIIISSPSKMEGALASLQQSYDSKKTSEEKKISTLRTQLQNKRAICQQQYDEIRQAIESIGIHELPSKQRPIASQLFSEDALRSQNNIAKEIKALIDDYHKEAQQEQQRKRAQQAAKEKAEAQARMNAMLEAKKREEEKDKAEKEAALQRQLEAERERKQKEELKKRLQRLIPAGIVFAIILLIILLNH